MSDHDQRFRMTPASRLPRLCATCLLVGVFTAGIATGVAQAQPGQPHGSAIFEERGSAAVPYESDILTARPVRWHIGLALGAMTFTHLGSYSPACDCLFEKEDGIRFLYGLEGSVYFPKMGIGARLQLEYVKADADFTRAEQRLAEVVGDDPPELLDFENTSKVQLSWLSITPAMTYTLPFTDVTFWGGLEIGIPLTARYDHVERVLTPGYRYYDGETTNTLLAETDIPDGTRLRLAFAAGMAVDIPIVGDLSLMPRAGIALPLTTVSSTDPTWKVLTGHIVFVLRWRLA
jgi:hypothetical protein